MPPPNIVINIEGGVVQQIYVDDPFQKVVLVDWDVDMDDYNHPHVVTLGEENDPQIRAYVVEVTAYPLNELAGTRLAAAIEALNLNDCACAAIGPFRR